jgi:excisionase family DNA binding protein
MQETANEAMGGAKEFYSLEEVADLLGVNYQLIYKLVRSGQLPAARIGKVYRVTRRDLDAYVEQSKGHAGGGTCAACGQTYHSRLSLKNNCVECGEPICVDCWGRKKIHTCPAHTGGAAATGKTQEDKNN